MKKQGTEKEKGLNQYSKVKRPTVTLTSEEHKLIAKFCIDNDMKIGDFLRRAGVHCVTKGIIPKE